MKDLEILELAVNSIRYRSLRSWLAILGVVIGVASIISLISISTGLQTQISNQLGGLGANVITITSGGGQAQRGGFGPPDANTRVSKPLTFKDADALRHISGVDKLDARLSGRATVTYHNKNSSLTVTGTEPNAFLQSANVQIAEGRSLRASDTNVAVVGYSVINRTFKADLLNKPILIDGMPFRVVGVLNASGATFGGSDNAVFIPQKTAMNLFNQTVNASSIVIVSAATSTPNATATALTNELLTLHHVTNDTQDFTVTTAASIQGTISSAISSLGLFLGIIASISLIVGGIGVANAMFTSVLEQTKYIGILKSLGATNGEVLRLFIFESGLVGLVGGLLGALLSFGASMLISNFGLPTQITPDLLFIGLGFSVIIGVVSGVLPARNAAMVAPVEALRYE